VSKKRILLVDDEKGFTDMLSLNLDAEGYEVKVENNSNEALEAAITFQPHLILLDVIMPNKEGPDVFIEIQNEEILKKTPIIFLTATITKEETEEDQTIGGHQFISKPADFDVLLQMIERNIMVSALNLENK